MRHINKYVIIGIASLVLIAILIGMYFLKENKPMSIIERTLKINLPKQAKVEKFSHHNEEGNFYAKITFQEQNQVEVISQVNKLFNGKTVSKEDFDELPNYEYICSWWDLEKENIKMAYFRLASGEKNGLKHLQKHVKYGHI